MSIALTDFRRRIDRITAAYDAEKQRRANLPQVVVWLPAKHGVEYGPLPRIKDGIGIYICREQDKEEFDAWLKEHEDEE